MKNNFILIKDIKQEELKSNSGIILTIEKYNRNAVVIKSLSHDIKEGDIVIKNIGTGTLFSIDGEDYEILHESNILAIQ
jgi:co-chaperonin GroES (HSP10)